jgi:predicted ribosomally synthesized peptide with nif11-like leader
MSQEQLNAFLEATKTDAGLQQKLQGVTEPDAVAAIAKEAGFSISAEDWFQHCAGDDDKKEIPPWMKKMYKTEPPKG